MARKTPIYTELIEKFVFVLRANLTFCTHKNYGQEKECFSATCELQLFDEHLSVVLCGTRNTEAEHKMHAKIVNILTRKLLRQNKFPSTATQLNEPKRPMPNWAMTKRGTHKHQRTLCFSGLQHAKIRIAFCALSQLLSSGPFDGIAFSNDDHHRLMTQSASEWTDNRPNDVINSYPSFASYRHDHHIPALTIRA